MNDDTWYVVRNTRGVTGFVGPGSKPVPLTEDEMMTLGVKTNERINVDLKREKMVKCYRRRLGRNSRRNQTY